MSSCDAYVSLHRSEGIGLTIAEAMGLGKPVIATGWSGNTDFMDVSNAFPWATGSSRSQRTPAPRGSVGRAIGRAGCRADALSSSITPTRRGCVAVRRETIQRDYSETRIAEMVRQRLAIIGERHQFDEFKHDVKALVAAYRDLVRDIRDVVGPRRAGGRRRDGGQQGRQQPLAVRRQNRPPLSGDRHGRLRRLSPRRQRCRDRGAGRGHRPGARVLLFPGTSLWWLDHYDGFRAHLDARYPRLWSDRQCVLYDVRQPGAPAVLG